MTTFDPDFGISTFWISTTAQELLNHTRETLRETQQDPLRASTVLRKQFTEVYSAEIVRQAVEFTLLRTKAQEKGYGAWAENGFFTKQALEQATVPFVAEYHAERFRGCKHILEICTGAGFDTAALARVADRVTSIEADPALAAMARYNVEQQGLTNVTVLTGRAEEVLPILDIADVDGFWSDPSRRDAQGNRIINPEEYKPALSWLQGLSLSKGALRGIKISPAVTLETFPLKTPEDHWQREWIGVANECREQVLWKSALRALPIQDGMVSLLNINTGETWFPPQISRSASVQVWSKSLEDLHGMYMLEPHGCLIRSGYLREFFAEQSWMLLDERIAYGIAKQKPVQSRFYQAFEILEALPFHRKILKRRVQELGWGTRTEIKKRGFPESPESLRAALQLKDTRDFGVIILTRMGLRHIVLLARRVYHNHDSC